MSGIKHTLLRFYSLLLSPNIIKPNMASSLSKQELSSLEKTITNLVSKVTSIRRELKNAEEELFCLVTSDLFVKAKCVLGDLGSSERTKDISHVHLKKKLKIEKSETDGFSYFNSNNLSNDNFIRENDYVIVYTDGACENNGKKNAKAGIGVWFGANHPLNISKAVIGRATNNTAEIQACIHAVETAIDKGISKLKIKTDSQFTISCMTQWIHKWKKNNWQLTSGGEVKNKADLIKLDNLCRQISVVWEHVAGHSGETGNEAADYLARQGAALYQN